MASGVVVPHNIPAVEAVVLATLGLFFFPSLFFLTKHVCMKTQAGILFRKTYGLDEGDALDICNKFVSSVQAVISSCCGLWIVSSCIGDIIYEQCIVTEVYAWFGFSYFYYDTFSMYYVFKHQKVNEQGGKPDLRSFLYEKSLLVVHHIILSPIGFSIVVHYRKGFGDCLVGFLYLMETSTPFVSLRGVLSKLKMKSSNLYVVNGLAMICIFFMCRIAALPLIALLYSLQERISMLEVISSLSSIAYIFLFLLLAPQVYWFTLMVKGACIILLRSRLSRMKKK